METMKTKIVIADDHNVILDGLTNMLSDQPFLDICKTVSSLEDIIPTLHYCSGEVLILDVNMNGRNTLKHIPKIKKDFPELKIIAFTSYDSPALYKEAISIGVNAYLTKNAGKDKLVNTIFKVLSDEKGAYVFTKPKKAEMQLPIKDKFIIEESLSKRELEILKLVAQGNTSQQIAESLFLSKHTVQWHRKNIIAKLQISTPSEMVKVAYEYGLV